MRIFFLSVYIALDTVIPYIRINNQMKFELAATPFRYILYVHTGSLHKNFKNHVENSLLFPLCTNILNPPPLWSEPLPLSRQILQAPLQNQMVGP